MSFPVSLIKQERRGEWSRLPLRKKTKRRIVECFRKIQYRNHVLAVMAIPKGYGLIGAYQCKFCEKFHIGHIQKGKIRTWNEKKKENN